MHTMVWHQFFCRSLFLQIGDFCFVLWGLIFVTNKTDFLFLLPGINFCDFQKVPDRALIIFLFLWSMCNRNTYFQTILQSATRCLKPVIHHTMFCFCGKFKLDYLQNYSGLHFSGKNVIFFYWNVLLWIARKITKIANKNLQKNCATWQLCTKSYLKCLKDYNGKIYNLILSQKMVESTLQAPKFTYKFSRLTSIHFFKELLKSIP